MRKTYILTCSICGEEFIGYSPKGRYCSHECRLENDRGKRTNSHIHRKKRNEVNRDLVDMAVEARKHGMTYGQYVGWLSMTSWKGKSKAQKIAR